MEEAESAGYGGAGLSISASMDESVRFAVGRALVPFGARVCSSSSFVDPEGTPMAWHDFGCLEGPGWAANAVGGAYELHLHARRRGDERQRSLAVSLLDHVLEDGFVDRETGFVTGYRDTRTGEPYLNFKHDRRWFCPGSMARIGCQMLAFSDHLDQRRRDALRAVASAMAGWLCRRVPDASNGWYPRRCAPSGEPFGERAEGGDDPLKEGSADGLFIVQLMTDLTARSLADYRGKVRQKVEAFMGAGGIYGSINHDTYDAHECVSYAAGFRVLLRAARLLGDEGVRLFAYRSALAGLDRFKMAEDRNGVHTAGLLFMEASWDTAYLWENAEASLAYLEAAADSPDASFRAEAVKILRAIALHHHGEHGFLTEGVDWNNHVGAEHHIGGTQYGDIRYTEPLLNNLHIVEPTLIALESMT